MNRKLYFCAFCNKVHYDNDYDGDEDIIIDNWEAFLESVENIKKDFKGGKQE